MKVSNKDCARVVRVQASADLFEPLVRACLEHRCPPVHGDHAFCNPQNSSDLLMCVSGGDSAGPLSRLQLGLAVRRAGDLHPLALLLAASRVALDLATTSDSFVSLSELISSLGERCGVSTSGPFFGQHPSRANAQQSTASNDQYSSELTGVLSAMETIHSAIATLSLQTCYSDRPLLSFEALKKVR